MPQLENLMKKMNLFVCLFSFGLLASSSKPPSVTFMTEVNRQTERVLQQIIEHPFLVELVNGTLPRDKFDYFNRQDGMYDWRYANSLLKLASKAYEPKLKSFLVTAAQHSTGGWKTPVPNEKDQCPSCEAYSNFEEVAVLESFSGGLAAIAPCYVIYDRVGSWLKEHSVPNNPYQSFIDSYSSPRFMKHASEMMGTLNIVANQEGGLGREKMLQNYVKSVSYEWQFWNSAYCLMPQQPFHQDK